jgi:hypothetical protein
MINEILKLKDAKVKEMERISNLLTTENRMATADEKTQLETASAEIDDLNSRIAYAQKIEANIVGDVKNDFSKEEKKAERQFNLFKMINEHSRNALSGLELEMAQEGQRELAGLGYDNALIVPQSLLNMKRAVTSATNAHFLKAELKDDLRVVNERLIMEKLGVTVYTDLVGEVSVPSMTQLTATGTSEGNAYSNSALTSSKATLKPNFYPLGQNFTRVFLNQTSKSLQDQILNQFLFGIQHGIEKAAFAKIEALTGSTNMVTITGATTNKDLVDMIGRLEYANAYVTTRKKMAQLMSLSTDTGSGVFVWANDRIAGIPAHGSSLVKDKYVFLADWSDMCLAFWGGLIVINDPYSRKGHGEISIQVARMADSAILNPLSFQTLVTA